MTTTAQRMLVSIGELAPAITARAAGIEANREVPADLLDALRSIGVFRIFVPQSHGGLELALPEALEIIGALARIDGSIGWISMIGSGSALFASLLPKESYGEFYKDGPDVIIAGSAVPLGTAEQVDGGWLVNGRWPFASGCTHAGWILGLCIMTSGGKPLPGAAGEGSPLIRGFLSPASGWQIEYTWHVIGLKGTGSHHIALKDTIVPDAQFFEIADGKPCLPGPLYQAVSSIIPILHGAIAVGIAEGALDDLLQLANTGWKQLRGTVPVRDSEIFQGELGRISANIRAARAFFEGQAASLWRHALAGTLKDSGLATQATQTAIWLATTCLRATDACFALGGSSALYENSPLQRRLRDLRTAAQHGVVQQRNYVTAGKWLLDSSAAAQAANLANKQFNNQEKKRMTKTTGSNAAKINNGVNVDALLGAREALEQTPEAAQFKWRASCEWVTGTHSRSVIGNYFGLGAEQSRDKNFRVEADHPKVFASEDNAPTPVEIVLSALASCLTAGVAAVAQRRGIQLRSVKATVEGDMDIQGILGMDDDIRNGFGGIRVHFDIRADASPDDIKSLVAQSQKRSAVFDIVTNPTNVFVTVN